MIPLLLCSNKYIKPNGLIIQVRQQLFRNLFKKNKMKYIDY